jgi:hypothetical protein
MVGIDPGDNNTFAAVELVRRSRCAPHREAVHTHLSRRRYEKRSWRDKAAAWEASRRRDNPSYGEAIAQLGQAGSWTTSDAVEMDEMLRCYARVWAALRGELVESKDHVLLKMRTKRKRRMMLDQAASRIVRPKGVPDVKNRGLVVGYGNARWKSRGPRVKMIQALVRAMRTLRREGRPAVLVFIDEWCTSKCCHRCFGVMTTPKARRTNGGWREDRRFRDCPHCGTQAAPIRWGRDSNAALNMLRKLDAILRNKTLPPALTRPERVQERGEPVQA